MTRKTGRKAWEWFAVPDPGDPGHETWPKDNDSWKIGGGALWLVGAADPDLGLVYFGTGNGVPQYAGDTARRRQPVSLLCSSRSTSRPAS